MHRSSSLLLLLLARRTTSETASARRARGIDAAEGGRFAEGCDALLGLELKENDAEAFFWAGWALRRRALAQHDDAAALGDLDAAAAHLGRAVAAAPAHASAFCSIASRDSRSAVPSFEVAVASKESGSSASARRISAAPAATRPASTSASPW